VINVPIRFSAAASVLRRTRSRAGQRAVYGSGSAYGAAKLERLRAARTSEAADGHGRVAGVDWGEEPLRGGRDAARWTPSSRGRRFRSRSFAPGFKAVVARGAEPTWRRTPSSGLFPNDCISSLRPHSRAGSAICRIVLPRLRTRTTN
jgi:hypothetical protein